MSSFTVSPRAYVALYLNKKKKQDLVSYATNVKTSVNGNANFATPGPYTLAELEDAIDDYSTKLAASETGGAFTKQEAIAARRVLEAILTGFGAYVQTIANEPANITNAASIILSAGMELRKTAEHGIVPDAVSNLQATFTYIAATIDLSWRRSKHADAFQVMMSTDPDNASSWTLVAFTAERKFTVDSLTTGQTYYFKVIALGTGGISPDSSIVSCIAA